jgi:hypothetical protein
MTDSVDHVEMPAICPNCRHHTSAWIGGACSVFVVDHPDHPDYVAFYCGCDCYKVVTGRDVLDGLTGPSTNRDPTTP